MGKFVIHPEAAENRFPIIPKYLMRRDLRCIACGRCAMRCIYGAHFRSEADYRKMADPDSTKCRHCLVCVQDCPVKALTISFNEAFLALGDELYLPDIIGTTWKDAETGKNPVSGGGYGGAFSGAGFDSFWTDMSEIVRPTRDGIHAREYISTVVDIGRKPKDISGLTFDDYGNPLTNIPPSLEVNLPLIFDLTTLPLKHEKVELAAAKTAAALGTLALIDRERMTTALEPYSSYLIESFNPDTMPWKELAHMARTRQALELHCVEDIARLPLSLKAINPDLVVMVRIEDPPDVEATMRLLFNAGADVIHLRTRKDLGAAIRKAHLALVSDALRDEITIIASGGVAEAAHVPKSIILGADAVAIDMPLLLALECVFCPQCKEPSACPRDLDGMTAEWGSKRISNLIASWHNQLLEMMGAMGLREVSRLRGEVGRAIFYDDMERELHRDFERAENEKPL